ncbi:AMP-binding protein [Gordonia sp. HY002]|uniref:class I adenylate-forming enzyme family protein n=1 Tax=Gordonia zhenghanii TaxID=2911516 RepID=UPI001EF0D57F|nr:AMP-binding protein [Gordonia zhenghanii]MCF8570384.1 AMP-binding protein [Gordonia zhenghanii]MCF8604614.1 AMP-binding protein [Gordonia zhenghanii]
MTKATSTGSESDTFGVVHRGPATPIEDWHAGDRLADRFHRLVAADPDRLVLADDNGRELTRAELWDRSGRLRDVLADTGVARGDVVLIYLPNTIEWQVSFLAVLRLRAVPATIPMSTDEDTLSHVHSVIRSRAIIGPSAYRGRSARDTVTAAARSTDRTCVVLVLDGAAVDLQTVDGVAGESVVDPEVGHLMFTSSTTGMPKAVMHTEDSLAAANSAFIDRFGIDEDTPIFMPSPLGHSVGAWHGARLSLFVGAPLILQGAWDPVRALEIVDERRCGFTAAATPFLKDIIDADWPADKHKLASMKTFLCGGAPVPPSVLDAATEQASTTFVTVLWGMTEGTGTTCVPESTRLQVLESAGRPVDGLDLRILDPDDRGIGELAMRGPGVFVGYLGQEQLFRDLHTPDGWFRTGDLARIDDDGYLHLTGRLKDIIIRGGVNISPVPIENAIAAHPGVRRVAVIGRPDQRLGERICAVIVPSDDAPRLDELCTWLRKRGLSDRMLPESLEVIDEMPVTAAGKIRKVDLRRRFDTELEEENV